jgi:hypothetical protein
MPVDCGDTVTLDVVLCLPTEARNRAVASSVALARRMADVGHPSHFRLGEPYPGGGGICEPHISLFMLAVTEPEVDGVADAVRKAADSLAPLPVRGAEYRHNPFGAPEMYYARSPAWVSLQRRVIECVEPLRQGRLRDVGPSGEPLAGAVTDALAGRIPADPAAVAQLIRYGYDEVADDGIGDRFRPHVTLAWPDAASPPVDLTGLPPADLYSGELRDLAVYRMSPYGTCTTEVATLTLSSLDAAPAHS